MKKYILSFLMLILCSYIVYSSCYDDDGGLNYKKKGICRDTNETSQGTDVCMKWGLVEYYCTSDNTCAAQIRTCEKCEDGVCLSKEADEVLNVNKPPETKFYALATPGKTEAAFKVDVSDPEGKMVVYTIDFGDGQKSSNKPYVLHDYKTNGTFTAKLTARDADGASSSYSAEVIIEPQKMVEAPKSNTNNEKSSVSTNSEKKGFFRKIIDFFKNLF